MGPTTAMTGVVVAQGGDRWWAWAASQVTPASGDGPKRRTALPIRPATVHNESSGPAHTVIQVGQVYGGMTVHEGQQVPPDDSAWLRSTWEPLAAAGAAMEIRYLTRPGGLDAFLVVRAEATDRAEAEGRVVTLRDQLGALPGHLTAAPVTSAADTHRILEPFRPHGEGIVEIRKRLTVQRTTRDDAHHPWLTAVTPLTYRRQPWDPLWTELAGLPAQAMLSVTLAPYPVGPGLRAHLAARATDLARLARPGPSPTAVWSVPRQPDEFAVAALPLISDAVRRYTDRAFLVRVSVAAAQPVPGVLAELAAGTISARNPNQGFAGAAPAVVRPSAAELPTAWHNITALDFTPLTAYRQGNPDGVIGDLEQVLGAIADLDEATAAFRLPYRAAPLS